MPRTFDLCWEAMHPDDGLPSGIALDPAGATAAFTYPGKVLRTGMFAWQKNRVDAAAELHLIDTARDEPRWAAELGADWGAQHLTANDVHGALVPRILGLGGGVVAVAVTWREHHERVALVALASGQVGATADAVDPVAGHFDRAEGTLLALGEGGIVRLAGGREPERIAGPEAAEAEAAVAPGGAVLWHGDDGLLRCVARGAVAWTAPLSLEPDRPLWRRIAAQGGVLWLAEAGRVRALDLATGSERGRAPAAHGPRAELAVVGTWLVAHDPDGGGAQWFDAATLAPSFDRAGPAPTGACAVDGGIVGAGPAGELWAVDAASGDGRVLRAPPEGLHVAAVQAAGGEVLALLVDDEGEASALWGVDPATGALVRERTLDGGVAALRALEGGGVALLDRRGVRLYR